MDDEVKTPLNTPMGLFSDMVKNSKQRPRRLKMVQKPHITVFWNPDGDSRFDDADISFPARLERGPDQLHRCAQNSKNLPDS